MQSPMRIAIIGGGNRCKAFLEMIDAKRFPHLHAEIVAVADPNDKAAGILLAKEKQIYTTTDYRDFYRIQDIDLVIELTGKEELLEDFRQHYPAKVRVLEATLSQLFGDIIRFREESIFQERQLDLIERIVESIFSSMRDSVLILRPDLKIVDANKAFLQSSGLNKEEVIGKFCYEIIHKSNLPCDAENGDCPVRKSLETGEAAHTIHEHTDTNGQPRYCEVTTMPLTGDRESPGLVLEIVRDITAELEKKVEQKTQAIKRNIARLVHEDKMIALGKLVASAVHEINNPLSGIHMLARLMHKELSEEELTEEKKDKFKYYLKLIDTESARCGNIVGNLLSFSRQRKGKREAFDLNEMIQKVILLSGLRLGLQKITLKLDLFGDLPPITGDPDQIQQCILNLIFNAIEAMPSGGRLHIKTRLETANNQVRLDVKDTGVGIPPENISTIFEPFFSTKSQDKGVGLGLSVVYGIIKDHGGAIFVKSEVGEGSRFIIRLPAGNQAIADS